MILFVLGIVWESFLSTYKVNDIFYYEPCIYAATDGGVVIYNPDTEELQRLTNVDGLTENNVQDIFVDSVGVWCLTRSEGLVIFTHGISYSYTNAQGLPESDRFSSMAVVGRRVWIATEDDAPVTVLELTANLADIERISYWNLPVTLGNKVLRVYYHDDSLWFCTENGIGVTDVEAGSWRVIPKTDLPGEVREAGITALEWCGDTLWIGTDSGIVMYVGGRSQLVNAYPEVFDFCKGDTLLLASTRWGVKKWNGTWWPSLTPLLYAPRGQGHLVILDSVVWVGSFKCGLVAWTMDTLLKDSFPTSMVSNITSSIALTPNGDIWVVHFTAWEPAITRIYEVEGEWYYAHYLEGEEAIKRARYIVSDSKGNLWISFWGGDVGLAKYIPESDTLKKVYLPGGGSNIVWGMYVDADDHVWVGTNGGYIFEIVDDSVINTWQFVTPGAFARDRYGNVWVGSHMYGIACIHEDGELEVLSDLLPTTWVTDIICDRVGDIWVATRAGVFRIRDGKVIDEYTSTNSELPSNDILALEEDWEGRIWMLVNMEGVSVLNPGSGELINYTTGDGLVASEYVDFTRDIIWDNERFAMWIPTRGGISKVTLSPAWEGEKIEIYPNPFVVGKHSGVTVVTPYGWQTMYLYTLSGRLIYSVAGEGDSHIIHVKGLDAIPVGVYQVVVKLADGRWVRGKLAVTR